MRKFCVVILAAGEGKRMKSGIPKVLHKVGGKPMVSRVVDAAKSMSADRIIVVVGRHAPEIREALDKKVELVCQSKPLGTADAVKAAKSMIPPDAKDVIVLYGDTPLIEATTIEALYDFHIEEDASCTVLTTFLDNPGGYGRVLRDDAGKFIGIVEEKEADFTQKTIKEINTGMYCFKRDDLLAELDFVGSLNRSGEFYLTDVFSQLFGKNKKIAAFQTRDGFGVLGVNSRFELLQARQIFQRRILEKHLDAGVDIMDTTTIFIDETAKIGAGTKIFPFTYIEKNVIIGKNCSIGPYCHLRENAVLKNGVSVGNFSEIKNSTLGDGTFMRHMSYLGDAEVGKGVNIGAGAVVANFDGKVKHKTVIKDHAFIGCDAVLIAPVVIGKNAVVGAGSVVTKRHDVAPGSIVVGMPAREIKAKKSNSSQKGGR